MDPQKKRILYVITKANWGGAQRYVYDLAVSAKQHGNSVLVAHGTSGQLVDELKKVGVETQHVKWLEREIGLVQEYKAYKNLSRLIDSWKPDVVHGNSSKAGTLAALAARVRGTKHILFTAHGWAWNSTWRSPLLRLAARIAHWLTVLLAHRTICVSETLHTEARWMPFVQNRFVVIHNGIELQSLIPREVARERLFPNSTNRFWVGTIAELHPTKGLDVLIQAFEHVLPDCPDVCLVIIGEGEERGRLEHLIQVEGVTGHVVLVGHLKDAAQYLSAFDLFVLPSRSEALGYVLLEAGMAHLPAIGSRVGGIPEIVVDEMTGLTVNPNDSRALTQALERLIKNEKLRARLGTALHEKVLAEFSLEQMLEKTFALYR